MAPQRFEHFIYFSLATASLVSASLPVTAEIDPTTDAVARPFYTLTAIARLQWDERILVIEAKEVDKYEVPFGFLLAANIASVRRGRGNLTPARSLGASIAASLNIGVEALCEIAGRNIKVVREWTEIAAMARLPVHCANYRARLFTVGRHVNPLPSPPVNLYGATYQCKGAGASPLTTSRQFWIMFVTDVSQSIMSPELGAHGAR